MLSCLVLSVFGLLNFIHFSRLRAIVIHDSVIVAIHVCQIENIVHVAFVSWSFVNHHTGGNWVLVIDTL
jgi:hypothetical protein